MLKQIQDSQTALKATILEVNPTEVHRTIAKQKAPQKAIMFAIYRGELVTHAQALELREADKR